MHVIFSFLSPISSKILKSILFNKLYVLSLKIQSKKNKQKYSWIEAVISSGMPLEKTDCNGYSCQCDYMHNKLQPRNEGHPCDLDLEAGTQNTFDSHSEVIQYMPLTQILKQEGTPLICFSGLQIYLGFIYLLIYKESGSYLKGGANMISILYLLLQYKTQIHKQKFQRLLPFYSIT